MSEISVQDQFASKSICFGCGPANAKGLQLKSHWIDGEFVMKYTPRTEHQAFPGVINGGIIGTLLDCHSNWCAATTLFKENSEGEFPVTVTAEFHVKLKRPTPFDVELEVVAWPIEVNGKKVVVEAKIIAADKITATCRGVFIAVTEGHPAHHRW